MTRNDLPPRPEEDGRAMVDTMILIYGSSSPRKNEAPDVAERRQQSVQLLMRSKVVRVAAPAWLEFVRGIDPIKLPTVQWRDKIQVEALDVVSAERAADLLRKHHALPRTCPRCLNVHGVKACPACSAAVPPSRRPIDAMLVAIADTLHDVDVLYSYDSGVLHLGQFARCTVKQPSDGPLFEKPAASRATEDRGARAKAGTKAPSS